MTSSLYNHKIQCIADFDAAFHRSLVDLLSAATQSVARYDYLWLLYEMGMRYVLADRVQAIRSFGKRK